MTQVERAEAMFGGQGAFWPAEEASLARAEAKKTLAGRFVVPPFSVLDARQGYWRARKSQWLALGIQSELGRDKAMTYNAGLHFYSNQKRMEKQLGRPLGYAEFMRDHFDATKEVPQTSVFDPVLCEIAYRWFCPPGGAVIDPFAGGSVRGVVASVLGRRYTGIDLRGEQVDANRSQWDAIATGAEDEPPPAWVQGDSRGLPVIAPGTHDLVFSCPPYFDLEVYSDDPADLSNAGDFDAFRAGHADIIRHAVDSLAPDRFAVWVIASIRDRKTGAVIDLVAETVAAFAAAGAVLHNEAILITSTGSLPIRVVKAFSGSRKLGKHHQQVLVFVKGDAKRAAQACGPIEILPGADAEPGAVEEALDERW